MWSLFSRDPATSFPYEIGDAVQPKEERSIFTLHYAKKKACGTPVSAFVCLGAVHNNAELELARSAVKRLRTLKHPCILDYIDSLESEKAVYLITSPVSPLLSWLMDCQLPDQHKLNVSGWGLRQVLKAISFLNTDGNLEHCNVCSSSVFVTPGGEWKLFGVEFCRPTSDSTQHRHPPPNRLPPSLAVYDAPEKTNVTRMKEMVAWSGDAWGIGCLMWEVFTVAPLMQSGALRNTTKFPAKVLPVYKTLLQERPSQRPDAGSVLKQLSTPGHFLDNDLLRTVDFLDNIHIEQDTDKQRFFSELTDRLDNIPDFIVKNKILPATLSAHQFSNVGSVVLAPLFKMSKLLSEPEYQSQVLPCVVRLFSSSDRATRLQLLQQMQHLIVHMDSTTVNDKVFPELATGFLDTNPTIREHTVKSVMHLAPKLNKHNLNVEVLKHFARLQAKDEQGGIRTNCTVCLGKVACNLAAATRQKCLISAFTRALRDPFPPARVAGIMALAATQHYYPLDQVALRILPALCPLAMDPEKSVRDAVFRVIKGFMGKLEKLSEDPTLKEEMESEVSAASTAAGSVGGAASGWAGWAVGTLTSKFYKSNISGGGPALQNQQTSSTNGSMDTKRASGGLNAKPRAPPVAAIKQQFSGSSSSHSVATVSLTASLDSAVEEGDGWKDDDDEDWKPIEDGPAESGAAETGGWADAEEEWGDLEQTAEEAPAPAMDTQRWDAGSSGSSLASAPRSARSSTNSAADIIAPPEDGSSWSSASSVKPAASYNWSSKGANPDSDDFFTAISTDKQVASSGGAATDDWGASWDDTATTAPAAPTKMSSSAESREQKRLERQRQIEAKRAAKGPMKLGTRKT